MAKSFGDRRRELYGNTSVATRPEERRISSASDARTHLRELYGEDWVDQHWPEVANALNQPGGLAQMQSFIQDSAVRKQEQGVEQLSGADYSPEQLMPAPPPAPAAQAAAQGTNPPQPGATPDQVPSINPSIDPLVQQLQEAGGDTAGVQQMAEVANADGQIDDTEQRGLESFIQQSLKEQDYLNADPERRQLADEAAAFYNPEVESSLPDDQRLSYDQLQYLNPEDTQEFADAAALAPGSAGYNFFKDDLGDQQAQLQLQRQQFEQMLQDPTLDMDQRAQVEQVLGQIGSAEVMNRVPELLGPGSTVLNIPGVDTPDQSMAESIVGMQTGGLSQTWNPRSMAKGVAGSLAARALMPDLPHSGISQAGSIQHGNASPLASFFGIAEEPTYSGVGYGGAYAPPSVDQAREIAEKQIAAYEMATGQPMDARQRMNTVRSYIDATQKLRDTDEERLRNYSSGHIQDIEAERAANVLPQVAMTPATAAAQSQAFDRAKFRPTGAPTPKPMGRLGRFGTMTGAGATGLMSAIPTGLDQSAQAASYGGGHTLGTDAVGLGSGGLTAWGTERGLVKGLSDTYQGLKGMGMQAPKFMQDARTAFQTGRQTTPPIGGARGAYNMVRHGGTEGLRNLGSGIADKFSRGGQNLKSLPGRAWNAAKSMPGGMARGAWGAAKAAPGAVGGMLKSAPGALKNFRPGNLGNMARSFASGGAGKLPALGNLARGAGNFALGGAAIDAGVNAGDAYGAVFGGERGRKLVRQGNKDMADQAAGRGVLGTIWNAPNVTSNARAMMGLQQQIQEAQQAGQQQMVGGYQGMINAGANDAVSQAVQQAGLDPGALSNYRQVTRMYGQDPERMQRMIASNPELQQVQQLQQTAKRDYHRNLASSGFSNTDAQNLSQYMQGGANDSILGSMVGMTGENRMGMSLPDIYKAAEGDEKLRSSLNNLYRGVASGKVDPRAASTLLGNVSTDRKELLNQFHQAITGGEK